MITSFFLQTTILNLTMNTMYEIMVRGATRSIIDPSVIIQGENTPPRKVLVARNCDKIPPLRHSSSKEFSIGVIAGIVCACFAVMLAITSFVLWRWVPPDIPRIQRRNKEKEKEKKNITNQKRIDSDLRSNNLCQIHPYRPIFKNFQPLIGIFDQWVSVIGEDDFVKWNQKIC